MSIITRALTLRSGAADSESRSAANSPTPDSRSGGDQTPHVTHNTPPLGYLPSLDGIRAIAVLAVMVFHSALPWLPGGFLGVDVFFVLSGFLITTLLLQEVERTGRIHFGAFYLRRARRLLPALAVVLVASAALVVLFAPDAAARLREDIVASSFYVTNWWNILSDQSYFEAMGRPPMLQHLWSLGLEEQFYLIWPAVLLFVFRRKGRDGVRKIALIGAFASTAWMLILSFTMGMPTDQDPSRLYFGSDTHAMTILAGAALATVWRPRALPRRLAPGPTAALSAIGVAAFAVMFWCFIAVDETSPFLYRGGFAVFAGISVVAIAIATHPAIAAAKILGNKPMVYLGKRSYGLYLWHWPIFLVLRPGIDIGWTGLPAFALQFALTLAAAELSYRYVEMPIRRGALGHIWRQLREGGLASFTRRAKIITASCLVALFALLFALLAIPATDATTYLNGATSVGTEDLTTTQASTTTGTDAGASTTTTGTSNTESAANTPVSTVPAGGEVPVPVDPTMTAPITPGENLTKRQITAVGDSVMLGARDALVAAMPKVTVDAEVSRQALPTYQRLKDRIAAGKLAQAVILHVGTNGPAYEKDLRAAVKNLSDRGRVVLVTAHMPDKWMDESNTSIRNVAKDFPNVRLADWAAAAEGHREYFVFDGTHLTGPGARAYAQTITTALNSK